MNQDFLSKTEMCACYHSNASSMERKNPAFTKNDAYREWQSAAYNEPEFLYAGDYITLYKRCMRKDAAHLNVEEVRASITFLLRQMRCEYAPYSCIVSGRLAALMARYIELVKGEFK